MDLNVGGIDRILRLAVGVALVMWAYLGGPVIAWLGTILLVTGAAGFCPIYPLVGMNTCQKKDGD